MPDPTKKPCSRCGETKPLDEFYRQQDGPLGRNSWCKLCLQARRRAHKLAHPDAENAWARARYAAKADRAALAAYARAYRQSHPEKAEQRREQARARAASHREQHRASARAWRAAHPERHRQDLAVWLAAHPGVDAEYTARRRARIRDAYVAPVNRRAIFERDGGRCGICRKPVAFESMHLDHVIPLARGGTHEPKNVQVTHPLCNQRKHATGPGQPRLLE